VNSRLLVVVGARPNFVKVAPVLHGLRAYPEIETRLLHTGQHYDHDLSGSFIQQLNFPPVDFSLSVGAGTHAEQTAAVMVGVERVLKEENFTAVLVAGDVNSTMATALAAAKVGVRVIHLEAGLRSGDWAMPEEINRVVTDRLSHLLLCHSVDAYENLVAEGTPEDFIETVGNTMIDSLYRLLPATTRGAAVERLGLEPGEFALVTLHRPALVDHPKRLAAVFEVLVDLSDIVDVVVPLHPRTRQGLESCHGLALDRLRLTEPLEYLDFIAVEAAAKLVITDSGGVQEETSALGITCLTYRSTTERPVTTREGTNWLLGTDPEVLRRACREVLSAPRSRASQEIPLWDGAAGPRAATAVARKLGEWGTDQLNGRNRVGRPGAATSTPLG
jgi:UDP-N-acetylglucosamine 2-epimerase (non-hydrolysing)